MVWKLESDNGASSWLLECVGSGPSSHWRDFESDLVEASSSLSFVVPAGLRGWRFADRQHSVRVFLACLVCHTLPLFLSSLLS